MDNLIKVFIVWNMKNQHAQHMNTRQEPMNPAGTMNRPASRSEQASAGVALATVLSSLH